MASNQIRRFSVTLRPELNETEDVTKPLNSDFKNGHTDLLSSGAKFKNNSEPKLWSPSDVKHKEPFETPDSPELKDDDVETRLLPEGEDTLRISIHSSGNNSVHLDPDAYVPLTVVDGTNDIGKAVAERGRQYAGRKVQRLVYKDGACNIAHTKVTERNRKFLVDIFTTVVDMKWRYNIIMFATGFVLSWFFFALIWFIIAIAHGDVDNKDTIDRKSCVNNVYDFQTALLFSIETQHTIGYGYRYIEPKCPDAFITLMFQSCIGVFIQTLMAGIVFAKLALPKRRAHTIMFSKKAVISKRDNKYCLLFRVGDMRKSHFVSTTIKALLIKDRKTLEGESIPLSQYALDLQTETSLTDSNDNFVFLVWPVTAVHTITETSPLWGISAESLLKERFELIVILQGVVEATGMTTQIRTSYLPSEILWGHRPASLLAYQKENGVYRIDYSQFHAVVPVSMPECSAKDFSERLRRASFSKDHALKDSFGFNSQAGWPPGRLYGSRRSNRWKALKTTMSFRRRVAGRSISAEESTATEGEKKEDSTAEEQNQSRFLSI